MLYTLEIQKLLNRAELLEDKNRDKVKYYMDAIHIADINDDADYAYELRHRLMDIEWNQSIRPNFIPTFGWLLDAFDQKPDQYPGDELLWKYKWVISELNSNPDVSREQIDGILEDFKKRSEREGYNLRAYYSKMLHEASDQHDVEKAREYQDKIDEYERDYISDCEACEIDSDVLVSLMEGDFDNAYSKSTPLLEGVHTCAKVPFITRVNLAYYAHKTGRDELVTRLVQEIEDELSGRQEDEYLVHSIGYFLALSLHLQQQRGWRHFEHFVPLTVDTDLSTLFSFSAGITEGLKNADMDQSVSLSLPDVHDLYNSSGQYKVVDIYNYYKDKASLLAERFDARNGNNNFSKQVAAI